MRAGKRATMKKIVLLSDGTGNSAAKLHKTNVWRLYQALELHRPDQVAFYDDGVGTQRFLPLKLLSGAFGYGLKRNVIELYKALCRVYEPGDKIYLFGFSRGAFTVRMLAGLIASQGLCPTVHDERKLHKAARSRFQAYRLEPRPGKKLVRGLLTYPVRWLLHERRRDEERRPPEIEFVGVWDTVAAYGFPIAELARLWDWFVLPLRFVDRRLPDNVRRACHALSVDDDRMSFRPVLWDEAHAAPTRIEQVWFAGAHADVGGGYPETQLALVTLDWMISKVEAFPFRDGLRFKYAARREHRADRDWHGKQHWPRSGLRAFYRYKTREIGRLCRCAGIQLPKVHRGVFERIRRRRVPYAPTGVPREYEIVATRPSTGGTPAYETGNQARQRAKAMESARNVVFWRRGLYFAFVIASAAALAAAARSLEDSELLGPAFWTRDLWRSGGLWTATVAGVVLAFLKKRLPVATDARAAAAWFALKGGPPPLPAPSWTASLRRLLDRPWLARLREFFLPVVLGSIVVLASVSAANRMLFPLRACCGLCESSEATKELEGEATVAFMIDDPCFATGIGLEKGEDYIIEVLLGKGDKWVDGWIESSPDGYRRWWMLPFASSRRHVFEPWMKLMGRIGPEGGETFAIGSGPLKYNARFDGELFLYVNDAVIGFPAGEDGWSLPYRWQFGLNRGEARVTITPSECCGP